MTEEELNHWESLAQLATAGPWAVFYDNEESGIEAMNANIENSTGAYVVWMDPNATITAWAEKEPEGPIYAPDNAVTIASHRTVNCGYDTVSGEPSGEEQVLLKPYDAAFIAASREAMLRLIREVRTLRMEVIELAPGPVCSWCGMSGHRVVR